MSDPVVPIPHTHRVTLLIAIAGLLLAGYALWRVDAARDREDATRDRVLQLEAADASLRAQLAAAADRDAKTRADLQKQWQQLADLPQQVRDLAGEYDVLRARTERPQRAWNRAEALYLVELAQRRLSFDRDPTTAAIALESADSRLAALHDPSLDSVRERLVKDVQALHSVPAPDRTGIVSRLSAIEAQVTSLPLKGIMVAQRSASTEPSPAESTLSAAWRSIAATFDRMFVVRHIDANHSGIVTLEEQALRRQHLTLLLYSARSAVIRGDGTAYRAALRGAHDWLTRYFDETQSTHNATREMTALLQIDISPPLPDISVTAKMLARSGPAAAATP
jgi:uroporphyrin-3 C-methyltransferase